MQKINIGDMIKATCRVGYPTVLCGKVEDLSCFYEPEIIQADGTRRWISPQIYDIEVIQSKKTSLQIELMEIIAQYRKDGNTDEWIKESFRRVWEELK